MDLTEPSSILLARWRDQRETPPADDRFGDWQLLGLTTGGTEVGLAGLGFSGSDPTAGLAELWIDPGHRRRGHGRRALDRLEARSRERGAENLVASTTPDPVQSRLFADWDITSRRMELTVGAEPRLPSDVVVRPATPDSFDRWRRHNLRGYAASIGAAGGLSSEAAAELAEKQFRQLLPAGIDTPDHEFWDLLAGGTPVANLWVHINRRKGYVFIYKVEADPAARGKGYGRAATRLAESRALATGLDQVRLHVFADNPTANGLYASLGYRVVQEHRRRSL